MTRKLRLQLAKYSLIAGILGCACGMIITILPAAIFLCFLGLFIHLLRMKDYIVAQIERESRVLDHMG